MAASGIRCPCSWAERKAGGGLARRALRCLALLLLLALGGAAYPAHELLDAHTVALYDFRTANETALVDLCGQGELASDGEAPPGLALGAGLILDGQTRLQGPLAPLTAPFTIEALIRLDGDSPGKIHGLFEQFNYLINGCRMGINPSGGNRVDFELSDPKKSTMIYVSGHTPLEKGKWYHVAATYDGKTERVWVNGKEDGATAWDGGLVPGPAGMTVGYESGPKYYFVGAIGYLRISNIARTSFPHGENPSGPAAAPLSAISARYPDVSAYFFPAGQEFPVTCSVSNATDQEQQYKLRLELSLLEGLPPGPLPNQGGGATLKVPPHAQAEAVIPVKLTTRGMYLASLVVESGGAEAWRKALPSFAIVEPLPPLAQVPASSHFGGQPLYYMPGSERVGMKWNRFWDYTTSWCKMEPERGQFNWEPTDKLLSNALAKGEQVLWCLCFTPGWASSIPDRATVLADPLVKGMYGEQLAPLYDSGNLAWQYPPRDMADWRRYVTAMVKRYGDRVKYWEVWNEANSGHFIGTPAQYTEVLKVAYETIKQVDPTATVVGIAGCPGWYGFTEEVFKLGGLKYMDVLSFHDYSYGVPEVFGCDKNVARTRELMRSYGRVLPMWDTEVGSPLPPKVHGRPMTYEEYRDGLERTVAGKPPSPWFARAIVSKSGEDFNISWGAIWPTTEDRAAKYLVRQFVLEMSEGMEKFNLHAGAAISRGKLPLLTGVSHAMMAKALATTTFLRHVPAASETTRVYLFRSKPPPKSSLQDTKNTKTVAVCWTTRDSDQAVVLTSARRVPMTDLYGNPGGLKGDGKRLVVPLTDSPLYLFGLPEDAQLWHPLEAHAPGVAIAGESYAVATVVNNAQTERLTGKVHFAKMPLGWSVEPEAAEVTVAAGGTARCAFTVRVPADAKRGQATLEALLDARGGAVACPIPVLIIVPTACPPAPPQAAVDGDLSEWTGPPPALLNTAQQVVVGKPSPMFEKLAGTWWGPDDLSARLWYGRTKDALWVALDVQDDSLTPPENMKLAYEKDCVELFLDGRALSAQANPRYSRGVVQLFISPPDAQGKCAVGMCQGTVAGLTTAGRRTPGGYTVEVRIPLTKANFPDFSPVSGAVFGFDCALDDADEGGQRKVQMVWQGSAINCQDTSLFARLRF